VKKLTVIHISTELGWRGGEQQVKLVTDGLKARGHEVHVFTPKDSALYRDRMQVGMAVPLKFHGEFDILAAGRIAAFARKVNADLIHAQTSHAHSLARTAAKKAGVPCVVSRRVDFRVGGNWFSRRKYRASNVHYIAISEGVKRALVESGINANRIQIVYSGIDPTRYPPRDHAQISTAGASRKEATILNVAALTDHKDHATLLRATDILRRRVSNIKLVIAGTGELKDELRALSSRLDIENLVQFSGHIADLAPVYRQADLFVMSSHMEGLCTSILDALAVGVPVAATAAGGIPEIIQHERNGLLSPIRDAEALAANMERLLRDAELVQRLVAAGRQTIAEKFTADKMVEGTIAAYENVLAGKIAQA
jgi:L-malate glycosyltransferase